MNTINSLLQRIEHAETLDFGTVFNACIETFKEVWLQGLVVLILNSILIIPLIFVIYIPMIFLGIFSLGSFNNVSSDFEGVIPIMVVVIVLLFVTLFILAIALQVGLQSAYYRIVRNKDLKLNVSDDYFFFFKRRQIKKTITLSLMMVGIIIVAALLCIVPIFYVVIPVSYMSVIYAMNPELSPSEIVKAGFALGNKKWFFSFGLAIIAWFLSSFVGFLMCFVGMYVTRQFVYLPFYQVYKATIGFKETTAIDEIGISLE